MPCNKTLILNNEPPTTGGDVTKGVAALLLVFVSPVTGFVVPLKVNPVPDVEAFGVIGIKNVLSRPARIGPAFVHVTVCPVVVQPHVLLVKLASVVTPAGKVMVVVITPDAEPLPMFLTVIGKSLDCPTVNGVNG